MSEVNVVTLIVAILAFLGSLFAIYNTNFKRFAAERWWERKAKAYGEIIQAFSELIHVKNTYGLGPSG